MKRDQNTMLRCFVLLVVVVGCSLTAVRGSFAGFQCVKVGEMAGAMPFCREILANASMETYYVADIIDPVIQDNDARAASETVLGMATSCRLIVISDQCVESYRRYACVNSFSSCRNESVTDDGVLPKALLQPCQDLCLRYCEDCKLDVCPCSHLPTTDCFEDAWNVASAEDDGQSSSATLSASLLTLAVSVAALRFDWR